jgi:tetratricopeptide (TPR) repeat protein
MRDNSRSDLPEGHDMMGDSKSAPPTAAAAPKARRMYGHGSSTRARLLILVALMLIAITHQARAQAPTDYYITKSDPAAANLLDRVEKYHLGPGIQNVRAHQYQYAYGELDFILRYIPNHPQALMLMSEVCVKWKQPARCNADAYLEKALQVNPGAADTYTIQGIYLQNTGRIEQAIESYKKALERNPSSVNAHYNLGLAYAGKKDFVKANEHAQQAYDLGMTLPGLRNALTKAGAWKPLPPKPAPAPSAGAPPADSKSEGGPPAQ